MASVTCFTFQKYENIEQFAVHGFIHIIEWVEWLSVAEAVGKLTEALSLLIR